MSGESGEQVPCAVSSFEYPPAPYFTYMLVALDFGDLQHIFLFNKRLLLTMTFQPFCAFLFASLIFAPNPTTCL